MAAITYSPLDMLDRLVGFDTTSRASNMALIEFVESYLSDHGIASTLVHNADRSKANLVATVGPGNVAGGVVLSGHSDVVPVDDQKWQSNPFQTVLRGDRIYGRGTCDMKGFLATVLALVPELQAYGLTRPVHIVLTYDEETDCGGAIRLMRDIHSLVLQPSAVIIGEPTEMQIVNAHKGHFPCRTTVTGLAAHSSLPHLGVNVIEVAIELMQNLGRLVDVYKTKALPMTGVEPPYTTINIGTIRGGTEFNIVAGECVFDWDIRPVPGLDPLDIVRSQEEFERTLLPGMRAIAPDAAIATEVVVSVPAFAPEDGSAAETLVMSLAATNQAFGTKFGTEAPCYQQAGMSVVVFGPGVLSRPTSQMNSLLLSKWTPVRRSCVRWAGVYVDSWTPGEVSASGEYIQSDWAGHSPRL